MLTIITVCYNSKKVIKQTLDSVLNQTFNNFEYVIIDGNSTDGTRDILNGYASKFAKKKIHFKFISENDNGIYEAMNKGVQLSQTKYITFLNSDDYLHYEFVQNMNDYLLKNFDFVYSSIYFIRNKKVKVFTPDIIDSNFKFNKMPFTHPGLVVKKEIFDEIGYFNPNLKYAADLNWIFKMLEKKSFTSILNPNPLIYFTIGGSGNSLKSLNESFHIYRKYNSLFFVSKYYFKTLLMLFLSKIKTRIINIIS
jgi:glycosyltransferase involved in cell wall biosynthesis